MQPNILLLQTLKLPDVNEFYIHIMCKYVVEAMVK